MKITNEEILQKGNLELKVKISGVAQSHIFTVTKYRSGFGEANYLFVNLDLPKAELARLSKELDFPFKSSTSSFFPPKKSITDFIIKS